MKKLVLLTMTVAFILQINCFATIAMPEGITAKGVVVMEQSTGKTIFEKNSHDKLSIASITKVMVLLIAMEQVDAGKLNFDTTMIQGTKNSKSVGGSTIFLDEGEKMPLKDIVKGICINSGNDAATALAEHIGGNEEGFVKLMNEKAKQLNMNDTQFKNATGLDIDGHYSSANDVAIMSRELIKHPKILEFSSIWMDKLRDGKFTLSNTNKLLKLYPYADGLKTGSTDAAKYCVSATAKKNDMRLIAVVLGDSSPDKRFADAKKLLEWGFEGFEVKNFGKAGDLAGEARVIKGDKENVKLMLESDINVLMEKSEIAGAKLEKKSVEQLNAPINKGQKSGEAVVKVGDKVISSVNIVTQNSADKINYWQAFVKLLTSWLKFGM